jgi:hypothetical protein
MKIIINLGREILLLGSVRESIMKPSETSSGNFFFNYPTYTTDILKPDTISNCLKKCFNNKI